MSTVIRSGGFTDFNVLNPVSFNEMLGQSMSILIHQATADPYMWATGVVTFTSTPTLYGLAQCCRDLSRSECKDCLDNALADSLKIGLKSRGVRMIYDSCIVRYEVYPFFQDSSPPLPPYVAPSLDWPENTGKRNKRGAHTIFIIIGSVGTGLVTVLLGFMAYYFWMRKKGANGPPTGATYSHVLQGKDGKSQDLPLIDLATLQASTDSFSDSNKLGQGGFGPVYKGKLPDGKEIAVKRLSRCSGQGLEEFMNEIILIAKLQHKNLVRLMGCCLEKDEKMLIYEYMPNKSLDFFLFENTGKRNKRGAHTIFIIIGIVGTVLVTVLLGFMAYYFLMRKKGANGPPTGATYSHVLQGKDGKSQDLPLIDLATLQASTDNFSDSNKLGKGGFGPVYKGKLPDGKEIAVKRLSRCSGQGLEEFMNEIILIAKLQHKNLVRLMGCCLEKDEKMLIYEYMPNKSLDFFLFDSIKGIELDGKRRFNIIAGIARGLLYLHEDSRLKVIHRDLKASNVLLDLDMNPKISDFGLARIFGVNQDEANTNKVVGTYGYMAPEYAMDGLFSIKSDVFSFGVLLLEIVSGKRNTGFYLSEKAQSLLAYAWQLWIEGRGMELMDPLLGQSCPVSDVLRYIQIGLLCVQEDPALRPAMSKVVLMLGTDSISLPKPTQPAFSLKRTTIDSLCGCSANEVTLSVMDPR